MDGGRVEERRGRQQDVKCQYERFIIYYVTTHLFNDIAMQIKFLHYSLYIPLLWKNWYDRFMGFDSKHFTYMYISSFSSYLLLYYCFLALSYSLVLSSSSPSLVVDQVTSMIRDERAGLGFSQSSRDMDTGSNAGSENRQKMLKHYHEVVEREAKRKKRFAWGFFDLWCHICKYCVIK